MSAITEDEIVAGREAFMRIAPPHINGFSAHAFVKVALEAAEKLRQQAAVASTAQTKKAS